MLRDGGVYVAISMHPPAQVEMFFKLPCFGWRFRWRQVEDKGSASTSASSKTEEGNNSEDAGGAATAEKKERRKNYHYVYFCTKVDDQAFDRHWESVLAAIERRPDEDPSMKKLPLEVRMHMH